MSIDRESTTMNTTTQQGFRIDWRSAVLGAGVAFAISWALVVRPARSEFRTLEAQIGRLSRTAARLDAARDGVSGTSRLLAALEEQAGRASVAETALRRVQALHERLAGQARAIDDALSTVGRIDELAAGIAESEETLALTTSLLAEVGGLADGTAATRESARRARATLDAIDVMHAELVRGGVALDEARTAASHLADLGEAVACEAAGVAAARKGLEELAGLKDSLLVATAGLDRAEAAFGRLARLKEDVAAETVGLEAAEETFGRLALLKDDLVAETAGLTAAEESGVRLGELKDRLISDAVGMGDAEAVSARLAVLKDGLVTETAGLTEAEATLGRLEDLAASIRTSAGMVRGLRDLVADMLLLEPAVQRAVQALEPVVAFTSLGRRMGERAPSQVADAPATEGETKVIGVARTPSDATARP